MTQRQRPALTRATIGAAIVGLVLVASVFGCSSTDSDRAGIAAIEEPTPVVPTAVALATPDPTQAPLATAEPTPTPEPTPSPEPTPTPEPTPVPTPTPVVNDEPFTAGVADRAIFQGLAGSYTWSTVAFPAKQVILRWDASSGGAACKVYWSIDPTSGTTLKGTIAVAAGVRAKGSKQFRTAFGDGAVVVDSRCGKFLVTMQGHNPAPIATKAPVGGGGGNCHPSYSPCLPIVGDLNCPAVRAMGKAPVRVIGYDDYRLDADHDGIGCE